MTTVRERLARGTGEAQPAMRRLAKWLLSHELLHPHYRRVGNRFSRAYHHLGSHTWEGSTSWMGVGAEKLPLDLWVVQEIIFQTRPELLIETGVRRGGSTLFYANLFDLLGAGRVLGIDITLDLVEAPVRSHPRIMLLEADSGGEDAARAGQEAAAAVPTMVILDADHAAAHVRRELDALGGLVTPGCYLIVEDTNLKTHPTLWVPDPGPQDALSEWLPLHPDFEVDRSREKFLATFNPGGFVRRRPS
jgi:cephalosporin hydroxylase